MGNQKKEDEKTEKIIRGLLKLPENRRCINCNMLGPQYVCTTFSTFVCTNCSGIHREFTHRVKSVSMAKFTPDEVIALQAGGNERVKQIYFKEWDSIRHSYPDTWDMHRLRDFIKHVYVDRKFTGARSQENLPRIKLHDKEESYGSKKNSSFGLELQTPKSTQSARSHDSSFRYVYNESRSPKYLQKYSTRGGFSKSPMKIEVVDDRFRDDDYRNRRHSNLEKKLKQLALEGPKNVDILQTQVSHSLGEVIGENTSSLQVTTSGGEDSIDENPSEPKSNNPENSIDLSIKSQASNTTAEVEPSENNWATFEASTENNEPKTPNTNTLISSTPMETSEPKFTNPLDLLLFELSGPLTSTNDGSVPTTTIVEKDNTLDFPPISMEQTPALASEMEQQAPNEAQVPQEEIHEVEESIEVSADSPSSISVGCSSTIDPINALINDLASYSEPSVSPKTHDTSNDFTEQFPETTSKPTQETRPDVGSQPNAVETKFSGRKELPEDLFTASYLSGPAPAPHASWQNVQHHVMGYGMQFYPNAVPPSTLPIASNFSNPFEVNEGRSLMHVSSFPTMASLQGVPSTISPRAELMHASSLSSLETIVPQSTSYASRVHPQSHFASGVTTGMCFDQVNNVEQYNRSQRAVPFNDCITGFGSIDTIQQPRGGYGTHQTPNSFSNKSGNPFE